MGLCNREAERLARPGEGEREERIVLVRAENRDLFIFFSSSDTLLKRKKNIGLPPVSLKRGRNGSSCTLRGKTNK